MKLYLTLVLAAATSATVNAQRRRELQPGNAGNEGNGGGNRLLDYYDDDDNAGPPDNIFTGKNTCVNNVVSLPWKSRAECCPVSFLLSAACLLSISRDTIALTCVD